MLVSHGNSAKGSSQTQIQSEAILLKNWTEEENIYIVFSLSGSICLIYNTFATYPEQMGQVLTRRCV